MPLNPLKIQKTQSYWSDQPGHPYYGVEWWFNGTNQKQGTAGWAQLTDTSHTGFYTTALYAANTEYINLGNSSEATILDWIDGITGFSGTGGIALGLGWMTSAGVRNGGHSVTLWGVDTESDLIYITDSDDNTTALQSYHYDPTTMYITDYGSGNGHIENLFGIDLWSKGVDPNPTLRSGQDVPEPASLALLGLGLAGLGALRRKQKSA